MNENPQLRLILGSANADRDAFPSASEPVLAALLRHHEATRLHSGSVAAWSRRIARSIGMSAAEVDFTERCGLLHDIGKVFTPHDILTKPGPLTADERVRMNAHADEGAALLESIPALAAYAAVVRAHHEHYDGGGYPYGLARDAIPFEARIVSVADAFDAMISNRSYRIGLRPAVAIEELRRCNGSQFDPLVVDGIVAIIVAPRRAVAARVAVGQ